MSVRHVVKSTVRKLPVSCATQTNRYGAPRYDQGSSETSSTIYVGFAEAYYDSFSGGKLSMLPLLRDTPSIDPVLIAPEKGECTDVFAENGISVDVVPYSDHLDRFGEKVLEDGYVGKSKTVLHLLRYYVRVFEYLRAKQFDVLYCNNLRAVLLFAPPAKLLGIPVVWYVRNDAAQPRLDSIGLGLGDHVITISDGVRDRFSAAQRRKYERKFETIYTGIDLDRFQPDCELKSSHEKNSDSLHRTDTDTPITITQIATIQPRKRQKTLVSAMGTIADEISNFKLVFAGNVAPGHEAYARELVEEALQAGIYENTALLGWCDDVPALLAETDICVLPSANEGLPRTLLEAAAMEVPVVATPAGGTEELVENGKTGLIVPVDDPDTLASAIRTLHGNPSLRRRMGEEAREKVVNEFDITTYVRNFDNYIREEVSGNSPRSKVKNALYDRVNCSVPE